MATNYDVPFSAPRQQIFISENILGKRIIVSDEAWKEITGVGTGGVNFVQEVFDVASQIRAEGWAEVAAIFVKDGMNYPNVYAQIILPSGKTFTIPLLFPYQFEPLVEVTFEVQGKAI